MSAQSVLFDAPGPKARRNIVYGNIAGTILVLGILAWAIVQMAEKGQFDAAKWAVMIEPDTWQFYFLPGLQNTLTAAAYSIVLAMVFGLLFGVGRLASNPLIRGFCSLIVEFFRAVPVLIMMIAGWFTAALVLNITPEDAPLFGVVIGLTLYNGSIIAELVRSGVHGLAKGQGEAALAIGMTRGQSLRSVELPQALIAMLPSLISQFVVILKDTALGYIITYPELLRSARLIGSDAPFPILQAFAVAAVMFIVINIVLSWLAGRLARRIGGRTGTAGKQAPGVGITTGLAGTADTRGEATGG
ncbi:amino acid ABC transporter permease [Ruania alba]|uniref:Amino acid ABC transporter membrane protein 2, PAAT family n=1 Tax=Ruania alba TaxID=648782 RepID=A0A1H5E6K0_9MICO|nr:amino acid ABC transporter permease [Ruania alba]SED86714.1 amino acid ABC transporter membrane protein 2, PAAT family [Ruania alba]